MATKKPLVQTNGKIEELQAGDTIESGVEGISALNNTGSQIDKGKAVHLKNNAGTLECELADASDNTKPCHGFAAANIPNSQSGTILRDGVMTDLSGLTPGADQWLSETAGAITETVPTTSGAINQVVGQAISTTSFEIDIEPEVRLA